MDINKVLTRGFTCQEALLSVGEFKRKLLRSDVIPIDPNDFYVTQNGRIVGDDRPIDPRWVYRVHPRLLGGKGGFGSMLRSMGATMKKTTNKNSCRDLSGRRIKDVENEKLLQEWLEKEPERERLKREKEEEKMTKKKRKLRRGQNEDGTDAKFFFNSTDYEKQRQKIEENQEQFFNEITAPSSSSSSSTSGELGGTKSLAEKKNDLDSAKAKRWFGNFYGGDEDNDDDDDEEDDDDDDMKVVPKKPRLELESDEVEVVTSQEETVAKQPLTSDDNDDAVDVDNGDGDDDDDVKPLSTNLADNADGISCVGEDNSIKPSGGDDDDDHGEVARTTPDGGDDTDDRKEPEATLDDDRVENGDNNMSAANMAGFKIVGYEDDDDDDDDVGPDNDTVLKLQR